MRRLGLAPAVIATALIAITISPLLTACQDTAGGSPQAAASGASATTASSAASSATSSASVPPSATTSSRPGDTDAPPTMTNTALPTTPPPPSGPVVCGQVPVPATGGQATVIADAGPGGPVPCADALRIVRTYLREAPSRGQGSAGVLDVEGWECATASMGSTTPGRATCRKDGRSVHTGQ